MLTALPTEMFAHFCHLVDVSMTDDVSHSLDTISTAREKRIAKSKTPDKKKKRQKNFHDKPLEHTEKAKKERCERDGSVHQTGIGMDGGHAAADDDVAAPKAKKAKKATTTKKCRHCHEMGHCLCTSSAHTTQNTQTALAISRLLHPWHSLVQALTLLPIRQQETRMNATSLTQSDLMMMPAVAMTSSLTPLTMKRIWKT